MVSGRHCVDDEQRGRTPPRPLDDPPRSRCLADEPTRRPARRRAPRRPRGAEPARPTPRRSRRGRSPPAGRSDACRDLEQQGRLADARLAAEQDHEPATSPPPSTRSSSPIPTAARRPSLGELARSRGAEGDAGAPGHARSAALAHEVSTRYSTRRRSGTGPPSAGRSAARLADEAALGRAPRGALVGAVRLRPALLGEPRSQAAVGSRVDDDRVPGRYRPSSRCSASGSSIRFWIMRRSGARRRPRRSRA